MFATNSLVCRHRARWFGLYQFLLLSVVSLASAASSSDELARQVLGNWLTEPRDGIIEISVASDGSYQGRIVGGNNPHRLDQSNPDPARRAQVLRGQLIMQRLIYQGQGKWSDGTIYDPDSGRTYKCQLSVLDQDRIKVRGFIGFALLGRSQVWTRYRGSSMNLPTVSP